MSGTQRAGRSLEAARFGSWSFRTDTRSSLRPWLWSASLLTASCTADITGGLDASGEESMVVPSGAGSGAIAQTASAGSGGASKPAAVQSGSAGRPTAGNNGQAGRMPAAVGGSGGAASAAGGRPAAEAGSGGSAGDSEPTDERSDAGMAGTGGATAGSGGSGGPVEVTPGGVRWVGRVDDRNPAAVRFSWAGAGFKAIVEGDTIAVRLESQGDAVYYQPVIDGEAGDRIRVDTGEHMVTLASGLSDGEHTVELYRDTEGDGPVSVFLGFEEGTVVGAPSAPSRFFEVVGDSISVGYGSMKTERHGSNPGPGCSGDHSSSSWFQTYGAVAARELDAELSTIARSGFGMVRGYGMNMSVMPPLFDDTVAGSNSPRWSFDRIPDALIINLGTNDWNGGDPGTSFETAYIDFIEQAREHYPDTLILLTIGPTLEDGRKRQVEARLQQVIEARSGAGDDKIEMIDIGIQGTDVTGCGWHPSAAEHMRVGNVLAQALQAKLGW